LVRGRGDSTKHGKIIGSSSEREIGRKYVILWAKRGPQGAVVKKRYIKRRRKDWAFNPGG